MPNSTIPLWRGNRIDGERTITLDQLAAGFTASEWGDDTEYAASWPLRRRLAVYIGANEGLGSTIEPEDFDTAYHHVAARPCARTV